MKLPYIDLHKRAEDERIDIIGNFVMGGKTVGVLVDDEPGKPERYIAKIKAKFPNIVVVDQFKGPTKGVVSIKFGPPPLS